MTGENGGWGGRATRRRPWWQRPFVWFGVLVLGALGVVAQDRIRAEVNSVVPDDEVLPRLIGTDAITVVDMTHLDNPFGGRTGYVVAPQVEPPRLVGDTTDETFRRWAEPNHAVDLEISAWEVALRGTRSHPVEIVDIVPVREEPCGPPLAGGLLNDSGQGEADKIVFDADVAADRPTLARVDPSTAEQTPHYFGSRKITLPRDETVTLVLRGVSTAEHCRWRYRIDYLADGERDTLLLSAPGDAPFEVTGLRPTYRDYAWVVPPAYLQCDAIGGGVARPTLAGADYEAFLDCSQGTG